MQRHNKVAEESGLLVLNLQKGNLAFRLSSMPLLERCFRGYFCYMYMASPFPSILH